MAETLETATARLQSELAAISAAASRGEITANNADKAVRELQGAVAAQTLAITEANRRAVEAGQSSTDREVAQRYQIDPTMRGHLGEGMRAVGGDDGILLVGGRTNDGDHVYGLLDDPQPHSDWQRELQRAMTQRSVVRISKGALDPRNRRGDRSTVQTPISDRQVMRLLRQGPAGISRIFTDSANVGAELLPDVTAAEIEREIRMAPGLASVFEQPAFPPSGSLILPYQSGVPRMYLESIPTGNDPASATKTDWGTGSNSLVAKGFAVAIQISRDAEEDAIIAVAPEIQRDMVLGIQYGVDDAILHGDTAATHQDTIASWNPRDLYKTTVGAGGASDHRRAWLGLIPEAFDLSTTTDSNAAQTFAGMMTAFSKLDGAVQGKMGSMGSPIVWVVPPEVAILKIIQFSEVLTLDKIANPAIHVGLAGFGLGGGAMPGMIGTLGGAPILMSPFMTRDLASTGLFTGSGTYGSMVAFDRTAYELRVRKGTVVEFEDDIGNNTRLTVARTRMLFRKKGLSTKKTAAYSFGWLS